MTSGAYYNEIDPFAAAWLRELIKDNLIAPGYVDERDIRDVKSEDLRGYTQCHFFAGIGGWSLALRLAGVSNDIRLWTGSCPCQPFSTAGKRGGNSDSRHLWPVWFSLIRECRPAIVFGEQVEAAIGHGWWDAVQRDLEREGYACGMAVLGAHSVGAPHRRQRLYFVAHAQAQRSGEARAGSGRSAQWVGGGGEYSELADTPDLRRLERRDAEGTTLQGECAERSGEPAETGHAGELSGGLEGLCGNGRMAYPQRQQEHEELPRSTEDEGGRGADGISGRGVAGASVDNPPSPRRDSAFGGTESKARNETRVRGLERGCEDGGVGNSEINGYERQSLRPNGESPLGTPQASFWSNALWLPCRDSKLRPVEPTIFPLAHGIPNRVGLLRGAGNAIVPQVAAEFIAAAMEGISLTQPPDRSTLISIEHPPS